MKHIFAIFLSVVSLCLIQAQDVERIMITGSIYVENNERENITVYNKNSKKGTTTNKKGEFKISVALNDIIVFDALQFQEFIITIDERILDSKEVSVQLIEHINRLDEVIVLPYGLVGNLNTDLNAVRTYNVDIDKIYEGIEDLDDYELTTDEYSKIVNDPVLDKNKFYNGVDFVKIFGLFFKKKKKKTKAEKLEETISPLTERYPPEFLKTHFKIPTDLAEAFIDYVENEKYDKALIKKKNEVLLLEHLYLKSQLFLSIRN